jgi:hypothetical protein
MTRGILIFAHNSKTFDYVKIASIAARLAKKNLGLPVSLVTDQDSLTSNVDIFDQVILTEKPSTENTRVVDNKIDYFFNFNRHKAYELTPYDHTLLIDSDLLILTNRLNDYWDTNESFLICERMNDLVGQRLTINEYRVGDKTIPLRWATAIMFKKDRQSRVIFDMVKKIQKDYSYYFDLYDFKLENFRNDVAFSIAAHIVKGFKDTEINLPPMLFINPTENIFSVDKGSIRLLLNSDGKSSMLSVKGADLHVMNKHDILKFENELCSVT